MGCEEWNGVRKLTPKTAREAYAMKGEKSEREVAKIFGVSSTTIHYLWSGVTWWRDIVGIKNFPVKLTKPFISKKLKWDEVQIIRQLKDSDFSSRNVAEMFNISHKMVLKIWNGVSWVEDNGVRV